MTKYTFNDPEKKLFKKHQGICKELADTCTNMEIVYVLFFGLLWLQIWNYMYEDYVYNVIFNGMKSFIFIF